MPVPMSMNWLIPACGHDLTAFTRNRRLSLREVPEVGQHRGDLLDRLAVDLEVVLAAERVVVHPRGARLGDVDVRRAPRTGPRPTSSSRSPAVGLHRLAAGHDGRDTPYRDNRGQVRSAYRSRSSRSTLSARPSAPPAQGGPGRTGLGGPCTPGTAGGVGAKDHAGADPATSAGGWCGRTSTGAAAVAARLLRAADVLRRDPVRAQAEARGVPGDLDRVARPRVGERRDVGVATVVPADAGDHRERVIRPGDRAAGDRSHDAGHGGQGAAPSWVRRPADTSVLPRCAASTQERRYASSNTCSIRDPPGPLFSPVRATAVTLGHVRLASFNVENLFERAGP